MFFALKGERFDGNAFAAQALLAGADYAVIDNPAYQAGERTILVENTLKTLQALARYHREMLGTPVIGITGTNGKTTTKELLAAVLSIRFNVLCTEGNLNNHIGVPLTLLRLTHEHNMAVIEMGASRPGDIGELTEIVQPNYGLITNVGRAHLEGFGSFKQVAKTKGELYDYLRRTQGYVFIRKDDLILSAMAIGIKQATYGASDAFISGFILSNHPFLTFEWTQRKISHIVKTQLVGDYNLNNALAAVTAGRYFQIPSWRISQAIAEYKPANNRSQWQQTASNTLIIDAYNANPDSMSAALRSFSAMMVSPKAVILGDMKELGTKSLSLHKEVVREVKAGGFDKVFLCGEQFMSACSPYPAYPAYPDTDALLAALRQNPLKGYYILIKGSHSMALEQVTDCL
ncbi:MAG: UDP-N-acetylmuramoyl-tripeptide--D-alanyl-D-alani ne ligase [Bacteroidales bacterium]